MATKVKRQRGTLYDADFYAWAREQAELLRAGRFRELDLANLIEEVDGLAGALKRFVRSRVRTIVEHLLKLQHSHATDPRAGWRATVRAQRADFVDDLTPTLRREVGGELGELYARARRLAEGALGDHAEDAAADTLPDSCTLPARPNHGRLAALRRRAHRPDQAEALPHAQR